MRFILRRKYQGTSLRSRLMQGGFMTNTDEGAANTVTWGVFPGKEIVQPTIIAEVSFCAWKA